MLNNNNNKIITSKGIFNVLLCQKTKAGYTAYGKKGNTVIFSNKNDILMIEEALRVAKLHS